MEEHCICLPCLICEFCYTSTVKMKDDYDDDGEKCITTVSNQKEKDFKWEKWNWSVACIRWKKKNLKMNIHIWRCVISVHMTYWRRAFSLKSGFIKINLDMNFFFGDLLQMELQNVVHVSIDLMEVRGEVINVDRGESCS